MVTFFGGLLLILIQHGIKYGVAWIRKRKRINQFTNQTDWRVSSGTFTGSNIFLDVPVSNSHLSDVEQSLRGERCGKQCLMIGSKIEIGYKWVRKCVRRSAIRLLSYQYFTGRTFITLSMLLSLASFGIYVSEASQWPNEIEKCGHKGRRHRLLDFLFNLFFLLHFLIRWAAADNKLIFWVDPFSLLDYCTVPPCLLAFALKRSWMGLRFMRIFRLFNLAEVLHNLNI
ncbi:unnamed protein product, partial [Hymenolepis diminuta]